MKFVDKISVKNDTYEIHDTAARTLITETGNQVGELQGDVQLLDAQMDLAVSGINSLRDEVTTIENKQTVDEANIYQNTTDIANIKPRVSAVEAVSSQNQADIVNLKSRMTTAENTLTTVNDSIDVINAINNQQTTQININKNDITALKGRMSAAEDDIADIRTDIDDLDERITASTYEAGIGIYFGQGDEHTNINIEDELIDKINAAGELGDRVTNLENNVQTINNNITTINNNITTINGEIDDIDDEIDDIWDAIHGGGGGGSGDTTIYSNIPGNEAFNPAKLGDVYIQDSVFRKSTRNIPTGPSTTTPGTYVTLREFAIFADNEHGNHWSEGGSLNGVQMGMNPADVLEAVFNTYLDNTPGVIVDETTNDRIKKRDYDNNPGLIYMDLITNTGEHRKIPMTTCNTVPITLEDPYGIYDSIPSKAYYIDFLDAENKIIYRYEYRVVITGTNYEMTITFYQVHQISVGADASLSARVTACETNITNIQGDITTINGDISTINSDITTINGDITNIQSDIGDLQSDMTTAQGDITTLQGDVTTINAFISPIQLDFSYTGQIPLTITNNNTATQIRAAINDYNNGKKVLARFYNSDTQYTWAECYEIKRNSNQYILYFWFMFDMLYDVQVKIVANDTITVTTEQAANYKPITITQSGSGYTMTNAARNQLYERIGQLSYETTSSILIEIRDTDGSCISTATAYKGVYGYVCEVPYIHSMAGVGNYSQRKLVIIVGPSSYTITSFDTSNDGLASLGAGYSHMGDSTSRVTNANNATPGLHMFITTTGTYTNYPPDLPITSNMYLSLTHNCVGTYDSTVGYMVPTANGFAEQILTELTHPDVVYRRYRNNSGTWSSWYKFTGTVVT